MLWLVKCSFRLTFKQKFKIYSGRSDGPTKAGDQFWVSILCHFPLAKLHSIYACIECNFGGWQGEGPAPFTPPHYQHTMLYRAALQHSSSYTKVN